MSVFLIDKLCFYQRTKYRNDVRSHHQREDRRETIQPALERLGEPQAVGKGSL